jgi:transcriptional regulator with XRE-family HTH domain
MAHALDDFIATLPKKERKLIDERARQLIAEELSLRDLRKAIGKTQTTLAKRLSIGQDAVSRLETRGDMHVSTLRNFLKAMGGELELLVRFPDLPPIRLEKLGTKPARRKRGRSAADSA